MIRKIMGINVMQITGMVLVPFFMILKEGLF